MLSKADENRLGEFERRILRKIYGPVNKKDTWLAAELPCYSQSKSYLTVPCRPAECNALL
jgi:hypothetical protein